MSLLLQMKKLTFHPSPLSIHPLWLKDENLILAWIFNAWLLPWTHKMLMLLLVHMFLYLYLSLHLHVCTPSHPTNLLLKILYWCSYWVVKFRSHFLDFQHSELNEEHVCRERKKQGKREKKRERESLTSSWFYDMLIIHYTGMRVLPS